MKTRTKVIVINGAPQSGKDTFVELAASYCKDDESANVLNLSSVDPIKDVLKGFGWDGMKSYEIRDVISLLKHIWIDAQNGPTMFLMNNILQFHMSHVGEDNIVFCHIREPKEIRKLVNVISGMEIMGIEIMTMYIRRDSVSSCITDDVRDSDNPRVISQYPYDRIIFNDEDLAKYDEKVCAFIDELLE